jgi:hypothetical protein
MNRFKVKNLFMEKKRVDYFSLTGIELYNLHKIIPYAGAIPHSIILEPKRRIPNRKSII